MVVSRVSADPRGRLWSARGPLRYSLPFSTATERCLDMTDRDRSRPACSRWSQLPRLAAGVLAGLVGCAAGAASLTGCDSSSDGAPFPEFEGRWVVDADTSTVSCPETAEIMTKGFSTWSNIGTASGGLAGVVSMEAGVLTDLVDTARPCVLGFDVKGTVATVPNTDPYTGKPPVCVVPFNGDDSSTVALTSKAETPLTFQLAKPVKGMAQQAFITGGADATLSVLDIAGDLQKLPPCTFAAQVGLHKITKLN